MNFLSVLKIFVATAFLLVSSIPPGWAQESPALVQPLQVDITPEDVEFLSYKSIQHRGRLYQMDLVDGDFQSFRYLPAEQKEKFLAVRQAILAKFVAVFAVAKVFAGVGAVVKNKAIFWRPEQRSMSEVYQESSHRITEKVLTVIDKELWRSAVAIADSNETAFSLNPRAFAGLMFKDKGFMPGVGLGVHFIYNHQSKDFAFELFGEYLKATNSFPVSGGVYGALGFVFRRSKDMMDEERFQSKKALYLPGPFIIENSPKEFSLAIAPALSLGLSNMLFDVKSWRVASLRYRSNKGSSSAQIISCNRVHIAVSN